MSENGWMSEICSIRLERILQMQKELNQLYVSKIDDEEAMIATANRIQYLKRQIREDMSKL